MLAFCMLMLMPAYTHSWAKVQLRLTKDDQCLAEPNKLNLRCCKMDKLIHLGNIAGHNPFPFCPILSKDLRVAVQSTFFIHPTISVHTVHQWLCQPHSLLHLFQIFRWYCHTGTNYHITQWCKNNSLHLNVRKTKELVIGAPKPHCTTATHSIIINLETVGMVDSFKYLGLKLDNKQSFEQHTPLTSTNAANKDYPQDQSPLIFSPSLAAPI